jgi:two-component system CheB/CheR fusion protein
VSEPASAAFEQLLEFLRDRRGFDFTGYKRSTLQRRIAKRMQGLGADSFTAYLDILDASPGEFTELFNTILINVTTFFRDPDSWDYLASEVLPQLLERKGEDDPIRVWSAGCASGQETYSLAMLFIEAIGEERFRDTVKIYGTDVDDDALVQARLGRYSAREPADLPEERRSRYFEPVEGGFGFRKDLRRAVIFGRHDLVQDAPISKIDLLACRNTLMYFTAETQRRVLGNFHFAVAPEGFLFLGRSEALVNRTGLFIGLDKRHHVFQRDGAVRGRAERPVLPAPSTSGGVDADEIWGAGLESSPVGALIVDRAANVVVANLEARNLFGIGVRQVGRPLKDLEVSYRLADLRSPVDQVLASGQPLRLGEFEWRRPGNDAVYLDVALTPLRLSTGLVRGVGIYFTDVTPYRRLQRDLEASQRELETAYEELQSTVEELETTNEEIQSTNEELETTNEELHSTNEELETLNEEMQSTNEELETTNEELRERTTELNQANGFLRSILAGLKAAVIVVDRDVSVRIWNDAATEVWGLRPDEVTGHHLMNLDIGLPVTELRGPIRDALDDRPPDEPVQLRAINRRGRTVDCSVSIAPLRDLRGRSTASSC